MKKYILSFVFLLLSGALLAQENLKVTFSYTGRGSSKTMLVVLTNSSDEMMIVRNDDGTGMGSLLQFAFLDSNKQEVGFLECNFNAPYSEYKRLIKIAPHSSASFNFSLGSLRKMGKKSSQLSTSVRVNCFIHYFTASQKNVGKPYQKSFIVSMDD